MIFFNQFIFKRLYPSKFTRYSFMKGIKKRKTNVSIMSVFEFASLFPFFYSLLLFCKSETRNPCLVEKYRITQTLMEWRRHDFRSILETRNIKIKLWIEHIYNYKINTKILNSLGVSSCDLKITGENTVLIAMVKVIQLNITVGKSFNSEIRGSMLNKPAI